MLTITNGTIQIDIINTRREVWSNLFDPSGRVHTVRGTVQLRHQGALLCEWDETDVDTVFEKLLVGPTFLADDLQVDMFFGEGTRHLHVWSATGVHAVAVTTDEDAYVPSVHAARGRYLMWRDNQDALAASDRP